MEFFASMRGAVHVAFEEATQWLPICSPPELARVVVCKRRGTPRQGNKGDQVDSAQLSELLRNGQLRSVYHGRADRRDLKELTRRDARRSTQGSRVRARFRRVAH